MKNTIKIVHMKACFILTIFLLLCASVIAILFVANTKPLESAHAQISTAILSEMSDTECVEFITENDIEIPSAFIDYPGLGAFVKKIICAVEINPNYPIIYNYGVTRDFVENIKTLVNDYYCATLNYSLQNFSFYSDNEPYKLQYNTVLSDGEWRDSNGDWDFSYIGYNCYSYAIGKTERAYDPGDFAKTGSFYFEINIYDLTLVVMDDLEFLGYDVEVHENIPVVLGQYESLICIRRTTSEDSSETDYHFMKYDSISDAWYHKPGGTAILKHNSVPSCEPWKKEYS